MNLEELHKKLYQHIDDQKKNWKHFIYAQEKGFYQGFDEIKIDGWRPTEKRFEMYDIKIFLSKEKSVLDIGTNCGFFALYTSRFVNSIDGVEINPYLVAIGNDTKKYLQIKNTNFHVSSFEDFETTKKFDVIFSFANDSTIDRNTKFNFIEYVEKILKLLNDHGILIFESQAADNMPKSKFDPKFDFLKKHFNVLENKIVFSEYPVNVPERIFLILEKNDS